MKIPKLELVLFDLIGTTVKDNGSGSSIILDSFQLAFSDNGIEVKKDRLNRERGKTKKEAIENILVAQGETTEKVLAIYNTFIEILTNNLDDFSPMEGASNVFKTLKTKRIKIGLGSGLPLGFMEKVVAQVGWSMAEFDYFNSFDELGEGRPSPIMIFEAMHKLGISDKRKILKIGDTVVDIQEGKNAGVLVAGVLSGSQNEEMLKRENPDYLFNNLLKFNNL